MPPRSVYYYYYYYAPISAYVFQVVSFLLEPPKPLKHSVLSHTCHSPRTSVQPQYNLSHQPLHHKLTLNLNFSVQVSFLKLACLLYKQQLLLFAVHDTEADRPPLYVASKQLVGIH